MMRYRPLDYFFKLAVDIGIFFLRVSISSLFHVPQFALDQHNLEIGLKDYSLSIKSTVASLHN